MNEKSLRWPDAFKLAPVETFVARRGTDEVLQHLMLAVLSDAINCYQEHASSRDPRGRRLHEEAASWLGASDREYVFSFESICDALGLDPSYIRNGLRAWRDEQLAGPGERTVRRRRRTRTSERRRRIAASF